MMQVRRSRPRVSGALLATVLGLAVLHAALVPAAPAGAVLPLPAVLGADALAAVRTVAGRLLLVRHAGTEPVVVDTTVLTGPALRLWWVDQRSGATVDGGSVPRRESVRLFPPDTGDGASGDWTLVVVDATRGLVPPM